MIRKVIESSNGKRQKSLKDKINLKDVNVGCNIPMIKLLVAIIFQHLFNTKYFITTTHMIPKEQNPHMTFKMHLEKV
jgi:hypothetical protein